MNAAELIRTKRDGGTLSPQSIQAFVAAYTRGEVPDYQVSAWLMAAFLQGLDETETAALTDAMLYSGEVLDLSATPGTKVDKHSTGGVGDKVSLVLAPIVTACGVPVPMISGRGLGHTGGTLDKLEAIPGFRTDLTTEAYRAQLEQLGIVLIGQTDEIAPADRKLYALRDVTATVECIPLIAASIMSKKLAEGIDALVLDVKCGRGAFMQAEADARRLAETLVGIGRRFDKETVAWMTRMDVPLGRAVGNWPETAESIACLRGAEVPDLMEVTLTLAGEMIWLGGQAASPEAGRTAAREALASGAAFDLFVRLVEAQGGDPSVVLDPEARPHTTPAATVEAPPDAAGYVVDIDALAVGRLAGALGAGRRKKEDPVDPTAGLVLHTKPGERVAPGQPLATLYTRRRDDLDRYAQALVAAYAFGPEPPPARSRLLARYDGTSWANPADGNTLQ